MNQTTNYQLNQWESTDRILMADFNADNAKLDAALKAQADAIAAKAAQSTVTALSQTVSTKASQSDMPALSQEPDSLSAQVDLRGNCQIYYTTYTGDGQTTRTLTFPGKPLLVLVQGGNLICHGIQGNPYFMCRTNGDSGELCTASWSGSSFTWKGTKYQNANQSGETYRLVALIAMDE